MAADSTATATPDRMSKGIHLGLERITALLRSLGDPQLATPVVHVAGTNGKGSVCAYLESIFRESGLQVGRFTSPHLVEVRDCITIKGRTISRAAYEESRRLVETADAKDKIQASSFELLTATAFLAFKREHPPLDLAVVEVGMGGRTDATNVCPKPLATVITPIDMDHQAFLGNTPAEIASVKGGIIKRGVPCIVSPQAYGEAMAALETIARSQDTTLIEVDPSRTLASLPSQQSDRSHKLAATVKAHFNGQVIEARLPLQGAYQLANVATAIETVAAISQQSDVPWKHCLTAEALRTGIEGTRWPGRLDWVTVQDRRVLVDGAHNPASIQELQAYLDSLSQEPTTIICSVSAPRDPAMLLQPLLSGRREGRNSIERVIAVPFTAPEGMPWVTPVDPASIAETARNLGVVAAAAATVSQAIKDAPSARVVICGSLYLVSDVYRLSGVLQ